MKKNVLERIDVAVRHFRNHERAVELADAHYLSCEVPQKQGQESNSKLFFD